jgi:hypothetical protein
MFSSISACRAFISAVSVLIRPSSSRIGVLFISAIVARISRLSVSTSPTSASLSTRFPVMPKP